MICKPCADAADGKDLVPYCSVCKRRAAVYNDAKPPKKQSVVVHKVAAMRCPGSKRPPVSGHDVCDRCDCGHRPAKNTPGNQPC